jgi:hypothetical protein
MFYKKKNGRIRWQQKTIEPLLLLFTTISIHTGNFAWIWISDLLYRKETGHVDGTELLQRKKRKNWRNI